MSRTNWVIALGAALTVMALLGRADYATEQRILDTYCEDVAVWAAEAARGIRPEHRTGHPDYHGIAAEQCPGMRPAQ